MSVAAISYNSLKDAANEASDVSRKLTSYANGLTNDVYRKLNNYGGSHTQNIYSAMQAVNRKADVLRSRAAAYSTYSTELRTLTEDCKRTDRSVRGMVSRLTGNFKRAHGISNSVIRNTFNYYLTSAKNRTSVGRWLGDKRDAQRGKGRYLKQCIKDWWHFEGGKQYIKGTVIAALEVVAAVCAIIGAITGGGIIAGIAGVIALVNGVTNMINESRAYHETRYNGDPARGRQLSKEDTLQDVMRNEWDKNVTFWHRFADGIDLVNMGCAIASILGSCGKLLKSACKWATSGSMMKRMKDLTSLKDFGSKLKLAIRSGFSEIISNIKHHYSDFSSFDKGTDTVKNIASTSKKLFEAKSTKKRIGVGITSVILPNLTFPGNGAVKWGSSKPFNPIGNLYKIGADIKKKVIDKGGKWLEGNEILSRNVLDKLSIKSHIHISIPEISFPDINIRVSGSAA